MSFAFSVDTFSAPKIPLRLIKLRVFLAIFNSSISHRLRRKDGFFPTKKRGMFCAGHYLQERALDELDHPVLDQGSVQEARNKFHQSIVCGILYERAYFIE